MTTSANHLPLHVLERYFPEEFGALQSVTSYTLLREPMDRFISGISQLARGTGKQPGEMSADAIRATADGVMDYLATAPRFPDFRHTLFIRQADYIDLDGQRVIDHAYPTEAIEQLMSRLEADHGLTLMRDTVWNPTVTYRLPAMAGGLKRLKKTAQKTLPLGAYVRLRDIGLRLFTSKGAPNLTDTLLSDARTKDFVAEFYAGDIALHRAALEAYPADKRAPQTA